MKYLLSVIVILFSLSVNAQKLSKGKTLEIVHNDTSNYDVKVTDSSGAMLAYVPKGESKLIILHPEAAARALYKEATKLTVMYRDMVYERSLLFDVVKNLGVTGTPTDLMAYNKALKRYLDYQYKKTGNNLKTK